ncbi:hypothetical protein Bca4012_103343 [Brassica carinata]
MIGRADIEGSKSNVAMNAWLPQASYPCDVPPSQTPHLTMSSAGSTAASLGSKRRGCYPLPVHDRIPLSAPVLSWLFDAKKLPRAVPSPSPADTRRAARALAARAVRQQSTGSNWDLRAQPSSQSFSGYGSILPTSLAYIVPSTRGCSPWRPDAVMSTTGRERTRSSGFSRARECTDTTRRAVLFQPRDPTSG